MKAFPRQVANLTRDGACAKRNVRPADLPCAVGVSSSAVSASVRLQPILAAVHVAPSANRRDINPNAYCSDVVLAPDGRHSYVTEPNIAALLDAVEQLRTDRALRARLVRNALHAAEMFDARRVARLLRSHLGLK